MRDDPITEQLILWAVYALLVLGGLHYGSKFIESMKQQTREPVINVRKVSL